MLWVRVRVGGGGGGGKTIEMWSVLVEEEEGRQ